VNRGSANPLEPPLYQSGQRVADARRNAGLSQKELASRLAVSLWTVDQLENGNADPSTHHRAIARATGSALESFTVPSDGEALPVTATQDRGRLRTLSRVEGGRHLVLASFALLVLIRFFTEVVPLVPRAANFVDIPIFVALAAAALTRQRRQEWLGANYLPLAAAVLTFLFICSISATLHSSRVAVGPVLVFLYGFLAPLAVYAAVYRLWPPGHAASMTQLVVVLTVVQFAVVAVIGLPRFIATGDPDQISGTFGTNQYQLVFFLLLSTAIAAGLFTFERGRLSSQFAPILILLALITIFLAQYRSLLLTTAVSLLLMAALLRRRPRGVVTAVLVLVAFVAALGYVATQFPALGFGSTITTYTTKPAYYARERLKVADSVIDVYSDEPTAIAIGTGPGTFSSRAWQTFALIESPSRANVAGPYISKISGGQAYHTDVSDAYVLPRYHEGAVIQGSKQLSSPLFEYVSLLAEVGLLGFLLIAGVYVGAATRALRQTGRLIRDAIPDDPLPALFLACSVAFTALLQMGFLDNWLEVTRVTFLSWMLLAVAHKELDSRSAPE
jgi:DNA-binding XRE family transcriptional regulator